MAEFLLHINYGGSYSLYFGVGRKHLKYFFRYRFMMPFISLLYRKDLDSSDVVALNLLFFFFFLKFYAMKCLICGQGFHINIQIEIALPCDTVVFSDVWSRIVVIVQNFSLSYCWFLYGFHFFVVVLL